MSSKDYIRAVNKLLASGQYKTLLAIVKGLRNGAVYGTKIRFPHALVMTFLFRRHEPLSAQARGILRATYTHARNLASFVFLYKALTAMLEKAQARRLQLHSFIAAFVGGYYIWGDYNRVNEQINLYLLSRILYALVQLCAERGYLPRPQSPDPGQPAAFPWFAAVVWGVVLWLFEYHKPHLQPSLQSSMTYLYHDSNKFNNVRNFVIYNK